MGDWDMMQPGTSALSHSCNPQADVKQSSRESPGRAFAAHLNCTVSHLAFVAQVWEACASTDAVLMPVQLNTWKQIPLFIHL